MARIQSLTAAEVRAVIAADMSGSIALITEYRAMQKIVRAIHAAGSDNGLIGEVVAGLTARQNTGQTIDQKRLQPAASRQVSTRAVRRMGASARTPCRYRSCPV